eukprot:1157549-Pelagomonas_calceolata.AAC.5
MLAQLAAGLPQHSIVFSFLQEAQATVSLLKWPIQGRRLVEARVLGESREQNGYLGKLAASWHGWLNRHEALPSRICNMTGLGLGMAEQFSAQEPEVPMPLGRKGRTSQPWRSFLENRHHAYAYLADYGQGGHHEGTHPVQPVPV